MRDTKPFLAILLICVFMISILPITAFATEYTITQKEWEGEEIKFKYNTVNDYPYVSLFYIGKTATQANEGFFYLIVWHNQSLTIRPYDGRIQGGNDMYILKTDDIRTANQYMFDTTLTSADITSVSKTTYGFQAIMIDMFSGEAYTGTEGDTTIIPKGIEEYYQYNIVGTEYDTSESLSGGETGDTEEETEDGTIGWLQKILNHITQIPNLLKDIINIFKIGTGVGILDVAGDLINENLKDNAFYTSLTSIKDTLSDLFNDDYTSRTGFYELGLTNLTLRKPTDKVYKDFGNNTIGKWEQEYTITTGNIDYGLENVKILNLDWFFGYDVGDGYYTKGVKQYTDTLIGAFLWLMFGWALYRNMPSWISGELTQITNLATNTISNETIYKTDIKTADKVKYNKSAGATYNKSGGATYNGKKGK